MRPARPLSPTLPRTLRLTCSSPHSRSYVDLLTGPHISYYNTLMKLFFIGSSGYVLFLMRFKFRSVSSPTPSSSSVHSR